MSSGTEDTPPAPLPTGGPDAPEDGEPTVEERRETRRALRWVAGCVLAVVAVYALVSAFVTDEAYLTRVGRYKELYFVLRDVREVDREALGDEPITWILGSSITRESFDAERIEARLREAGSEHRVVKFAFNRGAPVFSQAIADDLPLRPGDRIVTSVAEGNFRWGWLEEVADFSEYTQAILSPTECLALRDVALPTRLEWALAGTPPAAFFRNQMNFRRGLWKTMQYGVGLRRSRPRIKDNVSYQPFTDTDGTLSENSRQDWTVPADEVVLAPGQSNADGLQALVDDSRARGVDVVVAYVPGHPRLYEHFVEERTVRQLFDHMEARDDLTWVPLRARGHKAYMDYKHPNNRGRPGFSDELADALIDHEGLDPLPASEASWLAEPGEVPAPLRDGAD